MQEDDRKRKRAERFSSPPVVIDPAEEERKRRRLERFGQAGGTSQ